MSTVTIKPYWPENQDGTTYYPVNHRLVKETQNAKIVDVFIEKATKEPPHTHQPHSVMFVDYDTPLTVRLVAEDGQEQIVFKKETAKRDELLVDHMDPEPYHYVENNQPMHHYFAVRVENPEGKQMPFEKGVNPQNRAPSDKPYALWTVRVPENCSLSLKTEDFEGVLVAGKNSAFKAHQLLFDNEAALSPFELRGEKRLSIWHLPHSNSFRVENRKNEAETLYFLPV